MGGFFYHLQRHIDQIPAKYRFGITSAEDPGNEVLETMKKREALKRATANEKNGDKLDVARNDAILRAAEEVE